MTLSKQPAIGSVQQCVTIDGAQLDIVATRRGKGEWELAIVNERGIWSIWTDTFDSAQAAIDAGVQAIDDEGADTFTDIAGFDYTM